MSKSFLITSHTEGSFPFEQTSILHNLVKSLKKFFPDCFIVITSQSEVHFETQQIADYVIVDKTTVNQPHGAGEIALLSAGLNAMERFKRSDCFKMVYDFVIDETNYHLFDQWLSHKKEFVGCYWRTTGLGIGSWIWYGTIAIQKKILAFENLDRLLEWKILESIQNQNLINHCFIYENNETMFNGNWYEKCDLVHSGGAVLKYNYGTVGAVVDLDDQDSALAAMQIQSVANQSKKPNHLVIVDKRNQKLDLRVDRNFQILFDILANNGISWNLIFYQNENQILKHLVDLDFGWCWILPKENIPYSDTLKNYYRSIIKNHNIGTIHQIDQGLFYRNKIIENSVDVENLSKYIVDKMLETKYNNFIAGVV